MTEPAAIVVTIPQLPPRECGPNYHGHWRWRSRAAREWRECAYLSALAEHAGGAMNGLSVLRGPYLMDIEVSWHRNRKRMDSDNLVAACKPARDGIADALFGGDDSGIHVGAVTQLRGDGITRVTLRALAGSESGREGEA